MAGRDLKDLIAAYGQRDDLRFRRAAQALIDEQEAKRHTALAGELRSLLAGSTSVAVTEHVIPEAPVDRDTGAPLARVTSSSLRLRDLILSPSNEIALDELVHEVNHWELLDRHGVERRNRVLLWGPPGCGKTSAAQALAGELGRPLVTVRVDSLVSSLLGESAANLSKVFEMAAQQPCVLFLDEFDSLGTSRQDATDHGELRRLVNVVLQLLEPYVGPSLVVAATNYPDVLDPALWRRFDLILKLDVPNAFELDQLLRRELAGQFDDVVTPAVRALEGLPQAAAHYFAETVRRKSILSKGALGEDVVRLALDETTARRWT
ncbi:AAA family ATPase [Luteococcus japonicus]|uniref:Cell division protein FtsH n=1 Tax=Luteococcus japonicus LSP_Lj1 TaxID=1255658 RepID=A0A1R4JA07_9ACTN|nr:ATP-binding protein [Luteococcus japonicus]SJN28809.1 Cell division protein FtsH [Luteococcus japonicus LSP_Lj1]